MKEYRKINKKTRVFFDANEDYLDYEYVRNKVINEAKKTDPEVAEMYASDTKKVYTLCPLGHVIERAGLLFDIELYFEAGSAMWIGWDGWHGPR
jgi:hypothetical protein